MTHDLALLLGRALLALAFVGPGAFHLFEGWRERGLSAAAAFARQDRLSVA